MRRTANTRAGRILVQALALIVIGGAIGAADAFIRHDKVKLGRTIPPPPEPANPDTPAQQVDTPRQDSKPDQPAPIEKPATDAAKEPVKPVETDAAPRIDPPVTPTPPAALPAGHVTIDQSLRFYNEGATFIDARKKELYVVGHVPGSFRADMASFRGREPQFVSVLPKDMVMVVYCTGGNCDESEHVAQLLEASGFKTIYIMHDGFPGWESAGLPIETGEGME